MSRPFATHRAQWFAAAVVVLAALGALLVGGLSAVPARTYALRAPNQFTLLYLAPGHTVCEGPVVSPRPFLGVAIWGAAAGPSAALRLSARNPGNGRVLASGATVARPVEEEQRVVLNAAVAGGEPVKMCVTAERGHLAIAGAPAVDPRIVMTGKPTGQEFSLLLLREPGSLFSALPTAFSRAALFRPSWVGAWTFWVLAAGLLAGFALALVAVTRAVAADAQVAEEGRSPRT